MSFENNDHQTNSNHMTNYNRRQFLGVLGAGAVASTGLSQPVSAQETPVVKMGNNYFEPIGLHIEPGTTVRFEIAAGTHSATAYENRIPSDASAFDSEVISSGGFESTRSKNGHVRLLLHPTSRSGWSVASSSAALEVQQKTVRFRTVTCRERSDHEQGAIAYGFSTDGDGYSDGGMMGPGMGSGPGMMNGRNSGWGGGLPFVGGALGMLGLVGGLLYWALE